MLKRLHLRNFTVFADAEFEFGEGLNVLVGANGTGKTHVLKVGYSLLDNLLGYFIGIRPAMKDEISGELINYDRPRQWFVPNKLNSVFQPTPYYAGELVRRSGDSSDALLELTTDYFGEQFVNSLSIHPHTTSQPFVELPVTIKKGVRFSLPVFIPAKEVLTMGWLLALYSRREIPIDETYPDLLRLLSGPPLRQPEPAYIVEKLAQLIGGKVEEEGGHFYLTAENQPRLEMNLVAEGMRKFATLYKLLANGTLTPETTLFWDEPEANLNPALLKDMAAILTDLAQAGFQIILATHSLFLMRELHILAQQKKKPVRYFGLYKSEEGDVRVERQDDLMQLQHLVALDAELAQTFDFEAALDDEYAGDS